MSSTNIRDLLTSFSPSCDFFAVASPDGRIKIWDTLKGQLQTEFADIATSAADNALGVRSEQERGHLALDYRCMKWVQLQAKKKKKKVGSSLLALGTGSGDLLALDVSLGQLKWKVCDCHPGGVTAISFSGQNSCIYTAGVDGMVCQIDSSTGSILGKFKSSRKAISALSISADGRLLATAAAQLKIFSCSSNKKIHKFSGHAVAVRCVIFSEDGKYILSSAVGERYIAIWKMDGGKNQSASSVLSLEHPAVILDTKGSEGGGLYVLAISEVGLCYFWYGSSIEALRNSKPTKISLSFGSSISKSNKGLAIFAAKFDSVVQSASTWMLVAYGTLVKPLFEKLTVQYGEDMDLEASQDGVLLPMDQSYISHKGYKTLNKVIALDRANAEDATLPRPKLYVRDKKRKHSAAEVIAESEKVVDPVLGNKNKTLSARAEGYPREMEDGITSMEDKLRAAGILGGKDNLIVESRNLSDTSINATMHNGSQFSVDADASTKKIRRHVLSMSSGDAYNLLEILVSSWKARSATSKHALAWIYTILVIHGHFIMSQESSKELIGGLQKMMRSRCAAIHPLLNLSGRLPLIMAQIDKPGQRFIQTPSDEQHADESEDEDIDELVYGEEEDESQSSSGYDN